jgi:hypothetical protein
MLVPLINMWAGWPDAVVKKSPKNVAQDFVKFNNITFLVEKMPQEVGMFYIKIDQRKK